MSVDWGRVVGIALGVSFPTALMIVVISMVTENRYAQSESDLITKQCVYELHQKWQLTEDTAGRLCE